MALHNILIPNSLRSRFELHSSSWHDGCLSSLCRAGARRGAPGSRGGHGPHERRSLLAQSNACFSTAREVIREWPRRRPRRRRARRRRLRRRRSNNCLDLARPRGIGWPQCRPIPDFFPMDRGRSRPCPAGAHVRVRRRAGGTALGLAVFLQFLRRPAHGRVGRPRIDPSDRRRTC